MADVRELAEGDTWRAAKALLALRPHHGDEAAIARRADAQRAEGYRVVGSFEPGAEEASAAAGFRVQQMLMWGRVLYVDDLSTLSEHRGRGHADALFRWLDSELERSGCDSLQLDSGLGPERADAHRFYFRHGMRITSFHFGRRA
jgi:GNAT superfamily N-acetyltransferase